MRGSTYLADTNRQLAVARDGLCEVLSLGFGEKHVIRPRSGYFIVADIAHIPYELYQRAGDDLSKPRHALSPLCFDPFSSHISLHAPPGTSSSACG
jgi:hypothetical protein